jgi:hypothetical protein
MPSSKRTRSAEAPAAAAAPSSAAPARRRGAAPSAAAHSSALLAAAPAHASCPHVLGGVHVEVVRHVLASRHAHDAAAAAGACDRCGTRAGALYLCATCGSVGCGRLVHKHGLQHWRDFGGVVGDDEDEAATGGGSGSGGGGGSGDGGIGDGGGDWCFVNDARKSQWCCYRLVHAGG